MSDQDVTNSSKDLLTRAGSAHGAFRITARLSATWRSLGGVSPNRGSFALFVSLLSHLQRPSVMIIPELPANSSLTASPVADSPITLAFFHDSTCENIHHCRTIWNIVWSCLGTIFACVWVAIHPNLPQLHPPREKWCEKLQDGVLGMLDKLGISFLALLAPEFILAWALRQYFNASKLAQELDRALKNKDYLKYHDENDVQGYLSR